MRRRADPEVSGPLRTQSDGGPASRRDDERTPLSSHRHARFFSRLRWAISAISIGPSENWPFCALWVRSRR